MGNEAERITEADLDRIASRINAAEPASLRVWLRGLIAQVRDLLATTTSSPLTVEEAKQSRVTEARERIARGVRVFRPDIVNDLCDEIERAHKVQGDAVIDAHLLQVEVESLQKQITQQSPFEWDDSKPNFWRGAWRYHTSDQCLEFCAARPEHALAYIDELRAELMTASAPAPSPFPDLIPATTARTDGQLPSQTIPESALYWLKAAKDESYTMAERLFYMENAYNHVVDALVARPSSSAETVELARQALAETQDCDDCETVAVWERSDDPETHWHSCDQHKGTSPGWQEIKSVRLALKVASAVAVAVAAIPSVAGEAQPLDMLLFCPQCGEQHVDAPQPEKDWTNPPHKSHACQFCCAIWRPADAPTNGVLSIATTGKVDNHTARPRYFKTEQDFNDAVAAPSPPSSSAEIAKRIVGTVFDNTSASHETLKRVMIERIESELAATPVVTVSDPTLLDTAEYTLKACAISMCAGCAAQLTLADDGWHYPGQTEAEQGYEKQQCQVPMMRKLIAQMEGATPAETGLRDCPRKCPVCIDADHHWMPDVGENQPDDKIVLICKHCLATREAVDDDEY